MVNMNKTLTLIEQLIDEFEEENNTTLSDIILIGIDGGIRRIMLNEEEEGDYSIYG